MNPALLPSELRRIHNVRSTRELAAVLAEVEARIDREVELSDLEELATGHHGRTATRKVATFERDLPGWGGAASLYRLSPGVETNTGRVVEHVAVSLREHRESGALRQHVSPATASGFVLCQEHVQQPIATTCPREALRSLGYDVVEQAEGAVA